MRTLRLRRAIRRINVDAISIPNNPSLERKIIISFSILVVFLGILYGYFVKQTILNVVMREEIIEEMGDLGSHVSNLEVKYIELKNKIDLEFTYALGYKEVESVKFVSRSRLNKALTLNN